MPAFSQDALQGFSFGKSAIDSFGGAVNDLFAADSDRAKAQGIRLKAQGDALEGQNYDLASTLAQQNEQFTEQSTAIKQFQNDRQIYQTIGGQQADIAGAGFSASGSGIDLLRDSASQGALTKAVAAQQGLITEAGYTEQSQSYQNLSKAAGIAVQEDNVAAAAADKAAQGADVAAGIKGISGAFSGIAAVASIFAAPFTGGASLALGAAAESAVGDASGIGGLY